MKKRVIISLTFIFLIFILLTSNTSESKGSNKIDSQVIKEIQEKGKAKVIVVLKEQKDLPNEFKMISDQALREQIINKINKERVKHRFTSFNGFSASLTAEELAKLETDGRVERIEYDKPVHAFLQDSVPLINATLAWQVQVNGINITGEGETICIIDTGINYTHPDLGGCTIKNLTLNGNTEDYVLESSHNYTNNEDTIWKINYTGFSRIAVHFVNISLEYPGEYGGLDSHDRIIIYDKDMKEIANYHGINGVIQDLWTPSAEGDTIYVRLISDESFTDYGFYIDKIINGTTNTTYNWSSCSKVIDGWDMYNNDPDPYDDHGHGTHVAGIASANGAIKGVAPDTKIISIKALGSSGGGWESDVISGIEWCIDNSNFYNISVISMSLGDSKNYTNYCDNENSFFSSIINKAIKKNISIIVATGNDGNLTGISAPACIQNVTAVGATTKLDEIASYSNRNNITDLFAPGGDSSSPQTQINSTSISGDYIGMQGTSMATPHVAGAFALIRQFYKQQTGRILTPAEIQDVLNDTGKIIEDSAGSGLNFSRIDVYSAILQLDEIPRVTLNSPIDNYENITAVEKSIIFNCSATDSGLSSGLVSISLWITNSNNESFSLNQTASVSGKINSTTWTLNLQPGNYTWNCKATDNLGYSSFSSQNRSLRIEQAKQVILIIVDGMQVAHFNEMLQAGQLGNFSKVTSNGGWNGFANITGHSETDTAPGNAELHTGLNKTLNLVHNNSYWSAIPEGNTTFERLKNFNPNIVTGSIYGKQTNYIPDGILENAKTKVDWWHNKTTYENSNWLDGTTCTYSENVSNKAKEFIGNYSDQSFYLVVYFGVPDCSGHQYGENSSEYNQSLINVDNGIGILLNALEDNGLHGVRNVTQIIITADHGWNENSTGHNIANFDTLTIPLITNNALLVSNVTSNGIREQCEIAPTILDYFGFASNDYQDIINNGCESMIGSDTTPPRITILSPANNSWHNALRFNVTINEAGLCWAEFNNINITMINSSASMKEFYYINTLIAQTSTNKAYNVTFYCNDTMGNQNKSEMRFFGIDTDKPVIKLVEPEDEEEYTGSRTINFKFNVTDELNIISCKLIISGDETSITQNTNVIENGKINAISKYLDEGSYEWKISCTDEAGNENTSSEIWDLTISGEEEKSSSSEERDGKQKTEEPEGVIYDLTKKSILNETSKMLKKNDQVWINVTGRKHILTVTDVTSNSVRLKLESSPIIFDLKVGEEKRFDLNKDDYYDLLIKLSNIAHIYANITIKEIYEKAIVLKSETNATTENSINANLTQENTNSWIKNIKWETSLIYSGLVIGAFLIGFIIKLLLDKYSIRIQNWLTMRRLDKATYG